MKQADTQAKAVRRRLPPARSPEEREDQLVGLAMDEAERLLLDGKAPASLINKLIDLGTIKAKLELEKTRSEIRLQQAKTDTLESAQRMEELYANAIKAFKSYETGVQED